MKLLIGLGNPGKQYDSTRHNIGFAVLDGIARITNTSFTMEEKFSAEIATCTNSAGEKFLLVKPQTFMNRSGEAVGKIASFYKIPTENIAVIHDDLDIPLGEYKKSTDNSAGGHNGVQNIIDTLGTQQFVRYRIGIEGSERKKMRTMPGDAFVLQKFTPEEEMLLHMDTYVGEIAADFGL